MATKKFSEFDSVPTPVLADIELVGLDASNQNARFPGSVFDGAAWGNITGDITDQTDLISALDDKEDALGNPGTNGYVLSSTIAGVRSWVAQSGGGGAAWGSITGTLSAQTDLQTALDAKLDESLVSSFALTYLDDTTAPATRATMGINRRSTGYLEYITDAQPIAVLCFGDSNMVGIGGSLPGIQTNNPDVETWAMPTDAATYDTSLLDLYVIDPAGANRAVQYGSAVSQDIPYCGILCDDNGSTAFAISDQLQQLTNNPVKYLSISMGGTTAATQWQPGGICMDELDIQAPLFLSAVTGGTGKFDVVYCCLGGNDSATETPSAFSADMQVIYDYLVSEGYIDPDKVVWIHGELPRDFNGYEDNRWSGIQHWEADAQMRMMVASSATYPTADGVHLTPVGLDGMGRDGALLALTGPATKTSGGPLVYVTAAGAVFVDDVTTTNGVLTSLVADGATAIAHRLDTSAAYSTAGAKYLQISTDGVEKFSFGVGNIIRGDQTVNTALTFRVNDNPDYDLTYTATEGVFNNAGFNFGGPSGAVIASNRDASSSLSALLFYCNATMAGTGPIATFGDLADFNRVVISRTGLVTADDGFSTTAACAFGTTAITVPTATATGIPTAAVSVTGTTTYDFASSSMGNRNLINETAIIQQSMDVAGTNRTLAVAGTVQNISSVATLLGSFATIASAKTYTADSQAITLVSNSDYLSAPVFGATGGGTLNAVISASFFSGGTAGNGATVTSRAAVYALNYSLSGTGAVTNQTTVLSGLTTAGATNTTHIYMGAVGSFPIAGNYGIYQQDTLPNRLNGALMLPYRTSNGSATFGRGDYTIKFITTASVNCTFPDCSNTAGAAYNVGVVYTVLNNTGGNITLVPTGGDTFNNFGTGLTTTMANGTGRTYQGDGVSEWQLISNF